MSSSPGRRAEAHGAAITVLLVDDHPVVRRGLRALMDSLPGLEVIGEAASGEEAVREAQLLDPDVVVMDLQLPGMDGVAATAALLAACPRRSVLVLTMSEEQESVLAALRTGARGYLLKGAGQEEIAQAVRAVHAGQVVLSPTVAAAMVASVAGAPARSEPPFPQLTGRERDVLDGLAAGKSNGAIAAELGLALKTVGNHITSIFAKIGVERRSQAVVLARDHGLGRAGVGPPLSRSQTRR